MVGSDRNSSPEAYENGKNISIKGKAKDYKPRKRFNLFPLHDEP